METGYVQVYTGEGKGKTTASLGLALRAVCAGKKVIMLQFMKGSVYSELKAPSFLPGFSIESYGSAEFVKNPPSKKDIQHAQKGMIRLLDLAENGTYDIIIADELNVALHYGLISLEQALQVISRKRVPVELIFTGRNAHPEIIAAADLVTEMKEVKHYYQRGITARKGIEC